MNYFNIYLLRLTVKYLLFDVTESIKILLYFSLCVIIFYFVIIDWNNQTLLIKKIFFIPNQFILFQVNNFLLMKTVMLNIYLNSSRTIALDTRFVSSQSMKR